MDTSTRAAAHILLDLYSSTQSGDRASKERGVGISIQSLNEAEAFTARQNDNGELMLDLTPILLAAGISYQWLLDQLAMSTGRSTEELTFELRSFIDRLDD